MNASLGVSTEKKYIIGNHGLKKRNKKGEEALNLLRSHTFYTSTTFSIIKTIPRGRDLIPSVFIINHISNMYRLSLFILNQILIRLNL